MRLTNLERLDGIKRWVAVLLCSALAALRAMQYAVYQNKLLWLVETSIFVVLAVAFLRRMPPRVRATRAIEVLLPYVASILPFALVLFPEAPGRQWAWDAMIGGELLTIVGIATLGRSFGVSVQVRQLVSRGVYRWMRHPIYVGEVATTAGVAWMHRCPLAWTVLGAFALAQAWRARLEDRKLSGFREGAVQATPADGNPVRE